MEARGVAWSSSQAPKRSFSLKSFVKGVKQWSSSAGHRERSIRRILRCAEDVPEVDAADLDAQLKEDLLKFGRASRASVATAASSEAQAGETKFGLKELVDKILIADFFLILFALGWLTAGVFFKIATDSSIIMDSWLFLWPIIFQPAIGVLMLGALVSGAINWLRESSAKAS